MLHCHENGDCQELDDRHSERSRVVLDLSYSNQLMISNQNTHAFRANFIVAPFKVQWRLHWLNFFFFQIDTFASLPSSLFVKAANMRRSGAVVDSCSKQRRSCHTQQGAYGGSSPMVMVPKGACISALSHGTSIENDKKARFFPCLPHENMSP